MLLGDSFADIPNLKDHILSKFRMFADKMEYDTGREYLKYCVK